MSFSSMFSKRKSKFLTLVILTSLGCPNPGFAMFRSADKPPEGQPDPKRRRLEDSTNDSKISDYSSIVHHTPKAMYEERRGIEKDEE